MFTSENGEPIDISGLRRHLSKILKDADLPKIRLYDLRHSHGSNLLEQGVHIKTVSARLGHKDANMTLNRYLHVHPSLSKQAVDDLDKAFDQALESGKLDNPQNVSNGSAN